MHSLIFLTWILHQRWFDLNNEWNKFWKSFNFEFKHRFKRMEQQNILHTFSHVNLRQNNFSHHTSSDVQRNKLVIKVTSNFSYVINQIWNLNVKFMSHTKGIWIIIIIMNLLAIQKLSGILKKYSVVSIRFHRLNWCLTTITSMSMDRPENIFHKTASLWMYPYYDWNEHLTKHIDITIMCYWPPGSKIQNEYFEIKFYSILKGSLFILPKKNNHNWIHESSCMLHKFHGRLI